MLAHQANAWIIVHPAYIQSVPGFAAYLDADDSMDDLVRARRDGFQFTILQEDPVTTDNHTWGALKSLYR